MARLKVLNQGQFCSSKDICDAAKSPIMHMTAPAPATPHQERNYLAPMINHVETKKPWATHKEIQVHHCGQQTRLNTQSLHLILNPLFFMTALPSSKPCVCSASSLGFFPLFPLILKTHHSSSPEHIGHFSKSFTTLSSNSVLILMMTLRGMYGYGPHFTHQETEAQRGYINCPTVKRQSHCSNSGWCDFKALPPNCPHALAKLHHIAWADPLAHWILLSFVLLGNGDIYKVARVEDNIRQEPLRTQADSPCGDYTQESPPVEPKLNWRSPDFLLVLRS